MEIAILKMKNFWRKLKKMVQSERVQSITQFELSNQILDCGVYAVGFLDCRPSQGHGEPGIRIACRAGKRHNATDKP